MPYLVSEALRAHDLTQITLAAIGALRTQAQEILLRGANDPAFG
jgi:hypothetical protein